MTGSLLRYEVRRAGRPVLLAPPLAAAAVGTVALLGVRSGDDQRAAYAFFCVLEMAIPLAVGIGTGSLVGRDPALELQLTLPTRYRTTLLRRTAVAVGMGALVASVVSELLVATGWWQRWPRATGGWPGQLTWLAPTLALAAVGLLAAALLRAPAAAAAVVAGLWLFEQVAPDWVPSPLLLFATTRPFTGDWTVNRIVLLASAAVLLAAAWPLLGRAQWLLAGERSE
ncbi:hypothetical protein [Actinoplanes subtropicus]|uniref:hypothetical protein n=1 Tax=Actinoplanes subtropicus TaxID=543632 RepID=UPI0004C32A75|nr:hypothetical protein [Actinoplanes subtropicus]